LLPANRKRSPDPGDNPAMVAARRDVHAGGFYQTLAEALVGEILALRVRGALLDIGCGEGFYTGIMARALAPVSVYGVDISRAAVRLAARHCRSARFAVASSIDLPLPEACMDVALRIFAPAADAEIVRVLKPGAYYVEVSPAPRHLWQLREQLYEVPREHSPARVEVADLQLCRQLEVTYSIAAAPSLLASIIQMTPFAHRGERVNRNKLAANGLPRLDMAFALHVFRSEP
jgi:23S rRNA (guanine745-N1)-methyltransferase